MKVKVLFGGVFVILALGAMFGDALFFLYQKDRPSMVLVHSDQHGPGQGGGGHDGGLAQSYLLTQNELYGLPFRTPEDAIEELPYTLREDGSKEFYLTVDEVMWEYADGEFMHVWAFNGQIPGPQIRVTEGEQVWITVKNNLPVPTTVHWHGIHVENGADGVPGYTQYPIEPGDEYVYGFIADPPGTRFYHSHGNLEMGSVTQMDMGMSGAFIIDHKETPDGLSEHYDKEFVLLLDEWQINPDGSNGALDGLTASGGHAHGGHAPNYNVFTINGRIDPFVPPLRVAEGDRVLIRMINVGTQEVHPMHLHGHSSRVVARDGFVIPRDQQKFLDVVTVQPAERADVELDALNPGAWLFHCHHLHHAAAGMDVAFLYEGWEPCCQDV